MEDAIETKTITSLSQYTEFLEVGCKTRRLLFRGQSVDKPLYPKIARLKLGGKDYQEVEMQMLEELKRRAPLLLEYAPENDWEWLALAQHHGMATRLLDWTTNPLIALWFAVNSHPTNGEPGVVWLFETKDEDSARTGKDSSPFGGSKTIVFRPRNITPRIAAQSGWFTVHKYVASQRRFIALNHSDRYKNRLAKLTVPARAFAHLRPQLDRMDVNAFTMLKDLESLCRHVEWQNTSLFLTNESTQGGGANASAW